MSSQVYFLGISSPELKLDEVISIEAPPSTLFVGTISNINVNDKKTYCFDFLRTKQVIQLPPISLLTLYKKPGSFSNK